MLFEVGAYQVVRQLGQGGMGAVYEGVHRQTHQRVAIKMLLPQLSKQPDVVRRFFNEARAAGMIGDAAVVEVFEVGTLPDGAAYLVMEFLDGETLSAHLKQRGRLGAEALAVARDIAAALVKAHDKKIIHRDLKPENVMLVPTPAGLRVKVLDFGIAKIAQDAELAAGMGVPTKTGVVLGTPTYMSPEQCHGDKRVGAPTDVYALGAMLHQLVSGQPPFVGGGIGELLAMQLFETPPPLSQRVPGTAPALERLVLRMLDKQPERRPTMSEVLDALERLIAGDQELERSATAPSHPVSSSAPTILSAGAATTSTSTTPPTTIDATLAPARRSYVWVGVAVTAVAAATVIALFVGRAARAPRAPAPAPAQFATTAPTVAAAPAPPAARSGTIWWLVKSEPPRADVVRSSDGVLLGKTPWYTEQPLGKGTIEVIVRKSGFADQHATLDRGADSTLHVRLERRPGTTSRRPKSAAQEDELDVQPLR